MFTALIFNLRYCNINNLFVNKKFRILSKKEENIFSRHFAYLSPKTVNAKYFHSKIIKTTNISVFVRFYSSKKELQSLGFPDILEENM